ncbi:MAG: helix-turn-helix domain-containing protein [Clostridia bacterium]|nr:helix-turn-helix domain-containing protein [Clostridia bacterium]
MNKRKFINAPEELLKEGKQIVKEDKDKKYVYKVTLVNLMLERNIQAEEISRMSGVPRRTLSRWVKDVDERGFESLRNKPVGTVCCRLHGEDS